MVVTLTAGSEVNLVVRPATETACVRQRYTRAVRSVFPNLDRDGFSVFLNLPFYKLRHIKDNTTSTGKCNGKMQPETLNLAK